MFWRWICPHGIKSSLFIPLKFRAPKTRKRKASKIDSFNSKPNRTQHSRSLVKPLEDEVKFSIVPPMAWTHASGQLNPHREKYLIFGTQNHVNFDYESKFWFAASSNQVFFHMVGLRASRQANPDRDRIFQFSEIKYFRHRGVTNSLANAFKFGSLANLRTPTASFNVSYSKVAAY